MIKQDYMPPLRTPEKQASYRQCVFCPAPAVSSGLCEDCNHQLLEELNQQDQQ